MTTLSTASNPPGRRYVIGIVVAHSALLSLLCVLSFQSSGTGPPFAKLFLLSLLVSQSCLLAIWFAFSKASRRIRVCGLLLGVGALLILSLCAIAASGPIHELLGLEFEWLVMPLAGVVTVLATLRRLDLELVSPPQQVDVPDLQPRISLIGLLSIMAVVAALFALRPVTQSLAAYDRLSLYVFMQTVALSGMTVAAIWTALSGGTPWLRLLALSTIVLVAAFFFGYLVVDERSVGLYVTFSLILVAAAAIVVISLLCIRQTGIRCVPKTAGFRLVLLHMLIATTLAGGALSAIDFFYGKLKSGNLSNPFPSRTQISDPTGDARRAAMHEFLEAQSPSKLTQLLRLNGDTATEVDTIVGLSGGAGSYEAITSDGCNYIAVIGRRTAKTPPGLREQIAYDGASPDWMVQYSTACFFDSEGHLLGKVGGRLAADGVNGDDVSLTTLGTTDRWFVIVDSFEKHPPYDYQTEIRLVQPGFPTAYLLYHYPNSMSWTNTPESARPDPYLTVNGLPGRKFIPSGDMGIGSDGNPYWPSFFWDADHEKFIGPSQLIYQGQPCFEVDLNRSSDFTPADLGSETSSK